MHRQFLILLLLNEIWTQKRFKPALPGHGFPTYSVKIALPNHEMLHIVHDGLSVKTIHFGFLIQEEISKVEIEWYISSWIIDVLLIELI